MTGFKCLDADTLGFQLSRPLCQHRDMSAVPVKAVVQKLNIFMGSHAAATPEHDAIAFYLMNHAVAEVAKRVDKDAPLRDFLPIVDAYHAEQNVAATRMFYYLLIICTRESRHASIQASLRTKLDSQYPGCIPFWDKIHHLGSTGASGMLKTNPPDATIGDFCRFLCDVFYKGGFGSAFGGPAWGKVADCLKAFVTGEYSAEMMMDTAWTLCHNNGPIFNKGELYHHYDLYAIQKILDVQRSGQIPQLVAEGGLANFTTHGHKGYQQAAQHVLGDCMGGYVDWDVVEALGSMKKYPKEKQAQHAKYGLSEKAQQAQAAAAKQQAEAAAAAAAAQAKKEKDFFVVSDINGEEVMVPKIKIREVA